MIRLFRKIKKQFLAENKLGRYLIYAIGEIFLIVVGILIALGINNWNQNRLNKEKELFYLAGLKSEFAQSKLKLENLMAVNRSNYEESKRIIGFINDDVLPNEQLFSELLVKSFYNEVDYHPNNSLLNELINSGGLKNISNNRLRSRLTSWESMIQTIHRQENSLREQREKILNLLINNTNSIRTILDHVEVTTQEMGLAKAQNYTSNLNLLESKEFESNLLLFILTGIDTENIHYKPLLGEIETILNLLEEEIEG